ncbi:MAG: toxin-antitoxin system YwqK family antitoxin [bacterium]|jgi:antitoxin component YwqK of YwqJK toxin-antitoxin module|nr:hypothetical protein [Betaproteobacteria bacterium]
MLRHPVRPRLAATLRIAAALLLTVIGSADAWAIVRCQVDGRDVNPANGNTTAGLTGLMVCREADGRLVRERELKNGVFMGLERIQLPGGGVRERQVNERGNSDGPYSERDAKGTLRIDGQYSNGASIGLHRRFFDNGRPERFAFFSDGREQAVIEYHADGSLRSLRCAAQSVMTEDRTLCGFDGRAQVNEVRDSRGRLAARETWQQGRLLERTALREDGTPSGEQKVEDGRRVHREFSPGDGKPVLRRERVFEKDDALLRAGGRLAAEREWGPAGQPVRETLFADGLPVSEQLWYLNGQVRVRRLLEYLPLADGRNRSTLLREESFSDGGTLSARTTQRDGMLTGLQRYYDERGVLRREDLYTEAEPGRRGQRTRLLSRKSFDEKGTLVAEDEFFEDGSRKLKP